MSAPGISAPPAATAPTAPTAPEARLAEHRSFPPPAALAAGADLTDPAVYAEAAADPEDFWERAARRLDWAEHWHTVLDWRPPVTDPATGELTVPAARWFEGGPLIAAENCVDRHVRAGRGEKVALVVEGEPGDRLRVTYAELQGRVALAARALEDPGIVPGDRVVVYLPVLQETVVIALACARIGAVHSLVFGGFSAEAVAVKALADGAAAGLPTLEHELVVRRTGQEAPWAAGRDLWWHETVLSAPSTHRARAFPAEHPPCSSSTPPAPRDAPRASCTPPAVISPTPPGRTGPTSTPTRTMCTAAPRTSPG